MANEKMYIFDLPLSVQKTKTKMFKMNLNQYRNTHYRTLNTVKKNFSNMFLEKYGKCENKPLKHCWLHYEIFFNNNRKTDLMNIGSVVDKFASDCLVEFGYIEDDNREVVQEVVVTAGGVKKNEGFARLRVYKILDVPF